MNSIRSVAMGMSGGVDSSLSAALLVEQGYQVTGVFLECWRSPGCRVEEDRKDALSVALQLKIPFQVLDFKKEYRDKVVEYFFEEYKNGRTPNPDVLCNKEIKFGLFYDWAIDNGFDAVATGHYAQVQKIKDEYVLKRSSDEHKDQTYFLYRLRNDQLPHILFPIGEFQKPKVRQMAQERTIVTASKPDSQGICFIGDINVHDFLKERLGENPGEVVDTKGRVIGQHKGLWFYTIGQRHGFTSTMRRADQEGTDAHALPPYYVLRKDASKNQLVVGFGSESYLQEFDIETPHWIYSPPKHGEPILVRIRHTGKLLNGSILQTDASCRVVLKEPVQGIASGQSAVFYKDTVCLGGAVIV